MNWIDEYDQHRVTGTINVTYANTVLLDEIWEREESRARDAQLAAAVVAPPTTTAIGRFMR